MGLQRPTLEVGHASGSDSVRAGDCAVRGGVWGDFLTKKARFVIGANPDGPHRRASPSGGYEQRPHEQPPRPPPCRPRAAIPMPWALHASSKSTPPAAPASASSTSRATTSCEKAR